MYQSPSMPLYGLPPLIQSSRWSLNLVRSSAVPLNSSAKTVRQPAAPLTIDAGFGAVVSAGGGVEVGSVGVGSGPGVDVAPVGVDVAPVGIEVAAVGVTVVVGFFGFACVRLAT